MLELAADALRTVPELVASLGFFPDGSPAVVIEAGNLAVPDNNAPVRTDTYGDENE